MATYTYLAVDLKTNAVLAELPLTGVSFSRLLNGAGTFQGELPIGDPRVTTISPVSATEPSRTALFVDRDGVLIWGGIIWTRRRQSGKGSVQIQANELWSYFERRFITWSTSIYAGVDQMTIATDIITKAGGVANLGLVIPAAVPSGVVRTVSHYYHQYIQVATAVKDLAAMEFGFDYAVDVAYSGGVPTKTLRLYYPRRGIIATQSGLMFELPGNILAYDRPEDGKRLSTTVHVLGAGTGVGMLRSASSNQALVDAGYPLLEMVNNYKAETVQGNLDARAISDRKMFAQPVVTATVQVRADADPILGSYTVGDEARFRITDPWFPAPTGGGAGLDAFFRIVGYTVQPPEGGKYETVTLNLGPTLA